MFLGKPSAEFNAALEQVCEWDRYFKEYPAEKKMIFGAVGKFRFILIIGDTDAWNNETAMKWRRHHNENSMIEIRSMDVLLRQIRILREHPDKLWSFMENPKSLGFAGLDTYWKNLDTLI